jgi:integrase
MKIGTLRKILVSMGQIFRYATRHRYVAYNPFADAERPRADQSADQGHKIRVLNSAEINALLDTVKSQKYKMLFKLAIMSGMRQGELLGLKWSDVDWETSQIHVQRTYNNQAWYKPKTKNAERRVDIGPSMIVDLKRWRVACLPNKLDLIFPNEAGQPLNHSNMRSRYFEPALKKASLSKVRFHDLRHTFASLLIEQGENIKYIQSQLGHSSPTVTLNVYAHLMKPANQSAARRLEDAIFGTGHKMVTGG